MKVLVLGGTGFAGRAVAEEAARRGDEVTLFNRGRRGDASLVGDRLAPAGLSALESGEWDAVVDTWSAEGEAVRRTAELLRGRAGHYTYVSSRSVYRWLAPGPLTEAAPLVDQSEQGYAGDKLRGEIGAAAFGGPVLLARAGLILGPYEDVGRLPWWLNRIARGGPALAPGPRELPLQLIDVRDLAAFVLDAAARRLDGPFNVVSEPGHTTMGELLDLANEATGGNAELRWTDPEVIVKKGVEPWTQLPIWFPPGPEHEFMNTAGVGKAVGAGLRCRPVRETVFDTWSWLQSLGQQAPQRDDRPRVGLDPAVERELLAEQ
ncbi:NAD-dependent epimerase/dehydratase family protein [Paractinoplanes atraurantiacus]|uniref:Nucleoside-diphosphate-sugar epimerase n=1 Tax=Paractinoplanes atraurantiacus TaxID=1036182 RepID=A0A285IDV2_9ACTN|nr:NAD-dependent epimerase/dehydratase family protein [Actinoplanes atraurantiacus]SNY45131.1 Nucleoside-diphosphate-sugar epimerase [Actinoplanes atraurantiacus]